jgi:hypothetical protein
MVFHQIQATRLTPAWLLSRLYWQGASTVLTRRLLHDEAAVWRELPRRLLVAALFAPSALCRETSTRWLAVRWRRAYAAGFVRAALGWGVTGKARRMALMSSAAHAKAEPVSSALWMTGRLSGDAPGVGSVRESSGDPVSEPIGNQLPGEPSGKHFPEPPGRGSPGRKHIARPVS